MYETWQRRNLYVSGLNPKFSHQLLSAFTQLIYISRNSGQGQKLLPCDIFDKDKLNLMQKMDCTIFLKLLTMPRPPFLLWPTYNQVNILLTRLYLIHIVRSFPEFDLVVILCVYQTNFVVFAPWFDIRNQSWKKNK